MGLVRGAAVPHPRRPTQWPAATHVRVTQVVLIHQVGDGGTRDRRPPPAGIPPDQPARHVPSIRPARHGDAGAVNEAALSHGGNAGHDVPSRSLARIVVDEALVRIAEVVAAAIVGLEYDPAMRRHQLRLRGEGLERGRPRPPVNHEHQRIGTRLVKAGRVGKRAVASYAVRAGPVDRFRPAQCQRRDAGVQIREPARGAVRIRHDVQLGGICGSRSHESDRAGATIRHVDPERGVGAHSAKVELSRRCSVNRLLPERHTALIVRRHQQATPVGVPEGARQVPVERHGDVSRRAPSGGYHKQVTAKSGVAVSRIPVGELCSIGREERIAFVAFPTGWRGDRPRRDIQHLNGRLPEVARVWSRHPCEGEAAAVR